jgi:hypothetical protein
MEAFMRSVLIVAIMLSSFILLPNEATTQSWVCNPAFRFPSGDKDYWGSGPDANAALENARRACARLNSLNNQSVYCRTGPVNRGRCQQYDGCRAVRESGPRDHHNNHCIARGYMGYDPTPERETLGVGVCYKRQECALQRAGIDPF